MNSLKFLLLLSLPIITFAQDRVLGQWKTIDDETNEPKSVVEFYMVGDELHGKIVSILDKNVKNPNPTCDRCPEDDPRYMKPIKGLTIFTDLTYNAKESVWENGKVLDPEDGKIYNCKIWVDPDTGNLKVRGYLYFFHVTQTWLPM